MRSPNFVDDPDALLSWLIFLWPSCLLPWLYSGPPMEVLLHHTASDARLHPFLHRTRSWASIWDFICVLTLTVLIIILVYALTVLSILAFGWPLHKCQHRPFLDQCTNVLDPAGLLSRTCLLHYVHSIMFQTFQTLIKWKTSSKS